MSFHVLHLSTSDPDKNRAIRFTRGPAQPDLLQVNLLNLFPPSVNACALPMTRNESTATGFVFGTAANWASESTLNPFSILFLDYTTQEHHSCGPFLGYVL